MMKPLTNMVEKFRILLLAIFLFGLLGTGAELFLLGHVEGFSQLVPVVLMVMSLLVLAWHAIDRQSASVRAFRITMLLFLIGGIAGTILHYQANMEFELEMYPTMEGTELFSKVMTGATPTLAPGAMIQLGLIGLAYTFRHRAFERFEVAKGVQQ
jgi:hypothetical protein